MIKLNNLKNALTNKWEILIAIWLLIISLTIVYSYFLSWNENTRDVKRYTDILKINDNLKIYYTKNKTYPLSDESVSITASWEIITYQWFAWTKVFSDLWISEIKDPLLNKNYKYLNNYTYATDEKKQKYQLMWFYESDKNTKYQPNTVRKAFNYWDKVWIAIENKSERPIQETKLWVDVLNTLEAYTIYMDDETKYIWDKTNLNKLLNYTHFVKTLDTQAMSCLEIKNGWWNETWFYYIKPFNKLAWKTERKAITAYCDMDSNWGWWTRIYYKIWKNMCLNWSINYELDTIKNIFTKDFAVSDNLKSLNSEWSWLINNVNFENKNFDYEKIKNIINCKAPNWEKWTSDYIWWFVNIQWKLSTMWKWKDMFYWCNTKKTLWDDTVLRIWWFVNEKWAVHKWEFIHWTCNDYTEKDNSITSKWDWDNTRVIWVR